MIEIRIDPSNFIHAEVSGRGYPHSAARLYEFLIPLVDHTALALPILNPAPKLRCRLVIAIPDDKYVGCGTVQCCQARYVRQRSANKWRAVASRAHKNGATSLETKVPVDSVRDTH
jgi:hypothetical protein